MSVDPLSRSFARHAFSLRLQAILRRINDEIAANAVGGAAAAFVCECDNRSCVEAIELPVDLYRRLRLVPTRFIVRVDHVDAGTERTVAKARAYAIVERAPLGTGAGVPLRVVESGA